MTLTFHIGPFTVSIRVRRTHRKVSHDEKKQPPLWQVTAVFVANNH